MSTLQKAYNGFKNAFRDEGIVIEYQDGQVSGDDEYQKISCPFRPTVLPEEIDAQYLKPAILAIANQISTPVGRVTLSSHKDSEYKYKFVNLDIDDQGIWNLYVCVVK